jgi:uncharacterized membrane protein YgaE (UPF0421/DUF939 family)
VQVTPVSLLASGLDRVVAVVTGVSLAVVFTDVVPLEWWSLGVLIFVSIAIGQLLRLRSNLLEVAMSGMFVLGVRSLGAESAAWRRITVDGVGSADGSRPISGRGRSRCRGSTKPLPNAVWSGTDDHI